MVDPRVAITVGVVAGAGNGFREARVRDYGSGELPTADRFIYYTIGAGKILFPASNGQGIDRRTGEVVQHVVPSRTVVATAVVVVLEGAAEAVDLQSIVAQAVGHGSTVSVVDSEFQTMIEALTKNRLECVVVHHGARLGDQQAAVATDAQRGVDSGQPDVLAVVERGRGLIAIDGVLVDIAVILNVLALFADVARL